MATPERVSVVGAGLMGHALALVYALGGHRVGLYDSDPARLADALDRAIALHPTHGVTVLRHDGTEHTLPYASLRDQALGVLDALRHHGVGKGSPVLLAVQEAEPFLPTLWACLLGGLVPVPIGVLADEGEGATAPGAGEAPAPAPRSA